MILFKIIQSFLLLGLFFVMLLLWYRFIGDNRAHRKRMKKINQWSEFHEQLAGWSKEISDVTTRQKFMNECVNKLIEKVNDGIEGLDDWDIEEEKSKISKDWGKHIPSLLQELRQERLNKIGV